MLMNDHFSIQILSELSFNVYYFVGVALKLFKTLSCKKIWNIRKIKEYESLAIYVYVLFNKSIKTLLSYPPKPLDVPNKDFLSFH